MDGADLSTPTPMTMHHVSSRPTLGFPLGTALFLIIIFCLSGIFSCCYHWDKLRSLRRRQPHDHPPTTDAAAANTDLRQDSIPPSPPKLTSKHLQDFNESLPVIMPGDRIPKFMAWPCPCPCPCSYQPSSISSARIISVGMVIVGPSIHHSHSTPPVNC